MTTNALTVWRERRPPARRWVKKFIQRSEKGLCKGLEKIPCREMVETPQNPVPIGTGFFLVHTNFRRKELYTISLYES